MDLLTLVLVDDEPIILKGLLETYQWNRMGFQVIGAVRDGDAALEIIREKEPDVVLTDVRMKKMDGLTLIEKTKEMGIKTNFVVISAYRDFEYAQKACRNGALSYLVKPIEEDELERTMTEIYEMCTEQKYKEKNYSLWEKILLEDRDNFLNQMLGRYLDNGISEEELVDLFSSLSREEELKHYYVVAAAGIDITQQILDPKTFDMKQYVLDSDLYKRLKEKNRVWTKKAYDGISHYIVDVGKKPDVDKVRKVLAEIREDMKPDLISAMSFSGKGLLGMKKAYQQARQLFEVASEAGAGLLTGREQFTGIEKSTYSLDVETQILAAVRKNDEIRMKKSYERFIYVLPSDENQARVYLHRLAVRLEIALEEGNGLKNEIRNSFRNFYGAFEQVTLLKLIDILYQLLKTIIEIRIQEDHSPSDEYFKEYIPVALEFIQEHLHEETLSITNVSESVYLNPVYFGRMFKKVMNISFKRYVQNARLEKAKELLLEESESIGSIGNRVGIPNASYFSQLFKQSTGVLPSEYKRSLEE